MKATQDNVIVLRPDLAELTKGRIILPDTAKVPEQHGIVLSVGKDVEEINQHDIVLFEKAMARDFVYNEDERIALTIVPEPGILGVMTEAEAKKNGFRVPTIPRKVLEHFFPDYDKSGGLR